jgi:sugar-specific transcriptional regulator TrmB
MHIYNTILQLGYPASEVKIYLAALDIGESTITDLANKVGMPRTSVQSIIEDMHRRGLMNCYLKRRRKYWVAENPEKLMISLKEREAALKSVMPELQSKRFAHGGPPIVRIYNGAEQIKLIMDDIIETKHHLLAIVDWDNLRNFLGAEFMDDFIERRYEHFLKIRLLALRTPLAIDLKKVDEQQLRRTRFLPQGAGINNSNFIYGNHVAIISLNKRQPIGIVMEDPDIAHTMAVLFESLWQQGLEN